MKLKTIQKKVIPKKRVDLIFKYWLPVLTSILFVALFGISIFNLIYRTKEIKNEIISSDISKLSTIFKEIDKDCHILGFDYPNTYINFLNVEKFVGSEVGSMNLTYPSQWKGPYSKDNFEIQNKVYQIVKTDLGLFIVPGNGVILSDGKIIGKDIIFDKDADIEKMADKDGSLYNNGRPLAAKLELRKSVMSEFADATSYLYTSTLA